MKEGNCGIGQKFRSGLSVLAAVLMVLQSVAFPSFALENWPEDCYVLSEGACLMDAQSGVVLFDQNADVSYYPASITKVLTALIVLENCENLSETVTFSYDAVNIEEQNSTVIGASEGDRLSVLDCLYCLLFQSANEVANALAEHVGARHPELKEKGESDLQVFVKLMNAKAEELGCRGSHFNNPSGLTDENHYTTPYDMCLIMQAAIDNEEFCKIESHTYWTHAPIRRYPDANDPWNTVYMKHMMLRRNSDYYYRGCIAGKTGYTTTAGNTLVTACERDGMKLVCCVMNAHANHYNDTTKLFDFGFDNFRSVELEDVDSTDALVQKDFRINGIPVLDSFTLGLDTDTKLTLPKKGDVTDVTHEFVVLSAPEEGIVARMYYFYGEKDCGIAGMRLIPLGGMKEIQDASEDPMFYRLAGLELPETASAGTPEQLTGPAEDPEGGSEGNGESTAETKGAGTEEAESGEGKTETDTAADAAEDAEEKKADSPGTVKIVCFILLAAVVLLGSFVIIRYRGEAREEKRRHQRRLERMQKVSDLTGSQQISLDLEVRKKMENRGRHPGKKKRLSGKHTKVPESARSNKNRQ